MVSSENPETGVGYHSGELAVQHRAGVSEQAARLSGMVAAGDLRGGMTQFLSGRTFAAITARDRNGTLWTSPLTGPPGFLEPTQPTTLLIHSLPACGDPLHPLEAGQSVGLLVIEFATKRRVRINGTLQAVGADTLQIGVDQAYGNCPRYIQPRQLELLPPTGSDDSRTGSALAAGDIALIRQADTFILGTTHPTHGNDTSHRGGPTGFVRVDDATTLWWPDYPGNNMFNSLGNLAVDPTAAVLFIDFNAGGMLQLTGQAELLWAERRRVQFTLDRLTARPAPVQEG